MRSTNRIAARLVDLEAPGTELAAIDGQMLADPRHPTQQLLGLIRQLRPADRQIILLYLEGETPAQIYARSVMRDGSLA